MRYQITEGGSARVYEGFIRECPLLDRVFPVRAIYNRGQPQRRLHYGGLTMLWCCLCRFDVLEPLVPCVLCVRVLHIL